MMADVDSRNML